MKNKLIKIKKHRQQQVYDDRRLKKKNLGGILLLIFTVSLSTVSAQETITSSGGDGSGSGGSAAYSVGQILYTTNTGTTGSVTQGVQQPYEIFVVTGIDKTEISLDIKAYPNPATDYLILRISDEKTGQASFHLYDINGALILEQDIVANETRIAMDNLSPETYFLKVIENNKESKTFKIIKQ